jgi:DNA-3-methyladenine glycosylase II
MKPIGPFNLLHQNRFFNGWPALRGDDTTIVMAFPVEGWSGSAAVTLRQEEDGSVRVAAYGRASAERAVQQALAAMSLDEDGSLWPRVGERDEFLANLQRKYEYMRPTMFHSPYEAAAAFIIGHRITIPQARKIRASMAEEFGDKLEVAGESFDAFPSPEKLLTLESYRGLNETKISRLHEIAKAALDGWLDREHLRGVDDETALREIETLPGVGPFFSQGILYRGVGKKDGFTHDDMSYHAIRTAYELGDESGAEEILDVANRWRPYRMWATVLLHVWLRETGNFPTRTFGQRRKSRDSGDDAAVR